MKKCLQWIFCAAAAVMVFLKGIPIDIYNLMPLGFSFLGAAVMAFFLSKGFFSLTGRREGGQKREILIVPVVVFSLGLGFWFYMHFSAREAGRLKEDGIITEAVILDGKAMESSSGPGAVYAIDIEFKTGGGETVRTTESISENVFARVSKNQRIPVIYLPKNPKLVKPILTPQLVRRYTRSNSFKIRLKTLLEFRAIKEKNIPESLNKLGLWQFDREIELGKIWINIPSGETFIARKEHITYGSHDYNDLYTWKMDLKQNGFKEIDKTEDTSSQGTTIWITYENEGTRLQMGIISEIRGGTSDLKKSFSITVRIKSPQYTAGGKESI